MAKYRAIMKLVLAGRSYSEIVETVGCSRREVSVVRKTVLARGITGGQAAAMTDAELAELFPDGRQRVSGEYDQPDFSVTLSSMKHNRHFTVLQAWRRYLAATAVSGGKKYGYSQYCALFAEYARTRDVVATLQHEPGRAMLVDWAGDTIGLVDAVTGEVTRAYLFVAVLPFSGAVFCRAFTDMKSPSWLAAHVAAFEFYGGVVQLVVPDNPTTSTHQQARGEAARVVNARYQQLVDHYSTAVVPARARKPRDKAAAESAVNVVNKRVIGYLEDEVFTTLSELNTAIEERVAEINHDLKRADGSTRWGRFEEEEAHLLGPLPADRFEEVEWKELKVGRNYHVTADYQHYSVPYEHAGTLLRVRLTRSTVTIFDGNHIVCEHRRHHGRKGQYSTVADHAPAQHQNIDGLWSRAWFLDRARSFGPATVQVIEQILDRHGIEAQGYLPCQNILGGLGKNNRQRLEAACQQVLNQQSHPSYTTLKRVMAAIDSDAKQPRAKVRAASTEKRASDSRDGTVADVYVRDASHYQRNEVR